MEETLIKKQNGNFAKPVSKLRYREGHPMVISHLPLSPNINDVFLKKTSNPKML
jgi:hypothetical protein